MDLDDLDKRKNDLPKISESEFRKFLPTLIDPSADIERKRKWLDICIDPRLSVLVVNDKTGEVIHRVPPLIYTTQELTGRNISGTLDMLNKYNEVNPLMGRKFAAENIPTDLAIAKPPEEDVVLWRDILARYEVGGTSKGNDVDMASSLADDPDAW